MANPFGFFLLSILVSAGVGQEARATLDELFSIFNSMPTGNTPRGTTDDDYLDLIKKIIYNSSAQPTSTILNPVQLGTTQHPRTKQLIGSIFQTDRTQLPPGLDSVPSRLPGKPAAQMQATSLPNKSCGLQKECVPRLLCKDDKINKSGKLIIMIRANFGGCGYLQTCCDISDKTTVPIIPVKPAVQHEGCGYRNPEGVGYQISGAHHNETQFAEFPWMVAILLDEEVGGKIFNMYKCGGALIAPTVVLTGAHCVHSTQPDILLVRAGEWDAKTETESLPYQDRRVKNIIIHERFDKDVLFNDIALLFVDVPFQWAENVRPICLPESNAIFEYSRCFATGWGKDKFGRDGAYQAILKKIELPVVPSGQCQSNLRTTTLSEFFELDPSFICAGGEKGKDTCEGDGGSPLVCPVPGVKDRYYQAGIVAWGIGCGEENIPGVYANVAYLREWLNDKLKQNGINFSHFTP